jgi:hypothetical protein
MIVFQTAGAAAISPLPPEKVFRMRSGASVT